MDRTSAANYTTNASGKRVYQDRNLATGIPGTTLIATDRTAIQEEMMAVIEGAGFAGNAADNTLLLQAVQKMFGGGKAIFTTTGTFVVPAGVTKIRPRLWAPGGGGGGSVAQSGSAGSGGGAGGYAEGVFAVTPGQTIVITIGSPGAAGNGTGGGLGGASSVGSLLSATGGGGGNVALGAGPSTLAGSGGMGYGGSINLPGLPAATAVSILGTTQYTLGYGGASFGSGYGALVFVSTTNGAVAGNLGYFPGQGGMGGFMGGAGGAGGPGLCIIDW